MLAPCSALALGAALWGSGLAAQRPTYHDAQVSRINVTPPGVNCDRTPERCFKIHYVTSTEHAPPLADTQPQNGVPDYVDDIRTALLEVYEREIVRMGWTPPPSDRLSTTNGGDGRLDVYVAYVPCDRIARVQSEGADSLGSRSWYSFIVIAPDVKKCYDNSPINTGPGDLAVLSQADVVRDVMAHEYHHAVQNGLNVWAGDKIMEATSNWINDEVYDSINANVLSRTLGDFSLFTRPEAPLPSISYGGWFWLRYLSERFGRDVVRDIWQQMEKGTDDPVEATEWALAARGTTLRNAWTDFSGKVLARTWFEEGETYPDLLESGLANAASPHETYPVSGGTASVNRLARQYFLFTPPPSGASPGVLRVSVNGPDNEDVGAVLVAFTADGRAVELPVTLDPGSDGSVTVSGFNAAPPPASEFSRVTSLVLVLTNATRVGAVDFSYCTPDCGGVAGADPAIAPWGAGAGYKPPLWQTPDVWIDNDADCRPDASSGCNEQDQSGTPVVEAEPARGRINTLFARVRNLGSTATGDVAVRFLYGPCEPGSTPASLAEIGTRTIRLAAAGDAAGDDVRTVSVPWDLSDLGFNHGGAWDLPNTSAVETIAGFEDLCVRVAIEAPDDVNGANNTTLSVFENVPVQEDGGG